MTHFYEKIEDYLQGELSEPERVAFETACQSDPELANAVEQHRILLQRLEALRLRKKVASALEADRIRPSGSQEQRWVWYLAALLVFLAAAFWLFNRVQVSPETEKTLPPEQATPNPETRIENTPIASQTETPEAIPSPKTTQTSAGKMLALAQEYHLPPPISTIRDGSGNVSASGTALERAQAAYAEKKYALALNQLRNVIFTENQEEAIYLRANLRFMLHEYANAALDFYGLQNSFQFKQEARWNYMLCQLALGYQQSTRQLLSAMVADKDFAFQAKAQELQARLNF